MNKKFNSARLENSVNLWASLLSQSNHVETESHKLLPMSYFHINHCFNPAILLTQTGYHERKLVCFSYLCIQKYYYFLTQSYFSK